jgi:hypothetical protein
MVNKCLLLFKRKLAEQQQSLSFNIRHFAILSTPASRYVFAHNEVYHKKLSISAIQWRLTAIFIEIPGFFCFWQKQREVSPWLEQKSPPMNS